MEISKEFIERVKGLNPTVCIKRAKETDANAFVNLFNTYYKRKTNKAYFNWQFFESPFSSALFMAFDGDKLIGYYGIKIYPLTNNSNAGFAIDFLIDESYRKKGIAFLLDEQVNEFCKENKASCLTALPNAFGNAAFKALGYKSIQKINSLVLDIDIEYIKNLDLFDDVYNEVSQISFKKDEAYRLWRFDHNPLYNYKYVNLDTDCFGITKIFQDPNSNQSYGDIVDFQSNCINESILLIDKIITEMVKDNIKTITIWSLEHLPLYSVLNKMGFINQAHERYFCVKPLNPEYQNLTCINNWSLVQADAEIY